MEALKKNAGRARFWKCLVLVLLAAVPVLHAQQTTNASGSYSYKTADGLSTNQVIVFSAVPGAFRYEIHIERIGEQGSVPVQTLETTENRFEVSLRVGDYRFMVTAYNRMNLVERRSEWQNFHITPYENRLAEQVESSRPNAQENHLELIFAFGYAPMIAMFDTENAWKADEHSRGEYVSRLEGFNSLGYYIRIGAIPFTTRFGNFGIEAQFSFLADHYNRKQWEHEGFGFADIFEVMNYGTINFLYQVHIAGRWQHNVRVGLGRGEAYHQQEPYAAATAFYSDNPVSSFYVDVGFSTQYFIWKNLYLEAGIDLVFSRNFTYYNNHVMMRPSLGLGWQPGRQYAAPAANGEGSAD